MTRAEIMDALFDEVATFSGVAEGSVVWDRQKVGARPLPAIELRLEGPTTVGAPAGERIEEVDPADSTIVVGIVSDLEYVLRVQARTVDTGEAPALAKTTKRAFLLPSPLERLAEAGIVVVESGPVLDVGELVETNWQGRASFTVRIRVGDVEVDPERTTFIDSAPVTGAAE